MDLLRIRLVLIKLMKNVESCNILIFTEQWYSWSHVARLFRLLSPKSSLLGFLVFKMVTFQFIWLSTARVVLTDMHIYPRARLGTGLHPRILLLLAKPPTRPNKFSALPETRCFLIHRSSCLTHLGWHFGKSDRHKDRDRVVSLPLKHGISFG